MDLFTKIQTSILYELFLLGLGAGIGTSFKLLIRFIKKQYLRYSLQKKMNKVKQFATEKLDIVSLDHADPTYELGDIEVVDSGKKLIIAFPKSLRKVILEYDSNFKFRNSVSFSNEESFDDLVEITKISNLKNLITEHKFIVAKEFINKFKSGITVFNGEKFGVYDILRRRIGKDENAGVRLNFYKTDYFTHKVFRSIYDSLRREGHEISRIQKLEELAKYKPFTSSFGINAFVIINRENQESLILAKRSKYVDNTIEDRRWHVSMNEALTMTDVENNDISLIKCLHRGLREELGIKEEHIRFIKDEKFMDLFLVLRNFEIGISAYIKIDLSFIDLQMLYQSAKDGELETDKITNLDLNRREISHFIRSNKLTSSALYVLNMYTSRTKYFINKEFI